MDLRSLRFFVEVVRQGGFTQAGKTLFATQSTVSKAVKQLEDETGLTLIDRIGHRCKLTSAGEIVYQRAQRMLVEREDLLAELEEFRGLKRGTLRLGLLPVGSDTLFAPLFAAFRSCYPGIGIQLAEHGSEQLQELLSTGKIELAASLPPASEDFVWQDIQRVPLTVLLSSNDELASRRAVTLPDLKQRPFILFEAGFALNRVILEACRRRGFEPTIIAQSSQIDFMVELVAAGLGVTFLPATIALDRKHRSVACLELDELNLDWQIGTIWRRGAYLSHAARAWLELVRNTYGRT